MLEKTKEIVIAAGREEIVPRFNRVGHDFKADGSLVTEADLASQARIRDALQLAFPDIGFLGEEMPEDEQLAMMDKYAEQGLWCLDPLDGTSNFAAGVPYFAVSLALIRNHQIQFGVVYDPMRDECFHAQQGQGAFLNDKPLHKKIDSVPLENSIGIIDFKRLAPALATKLVVEQPFASQRSFGSVALDWCWLAAGRGHVYLHGKQRVWDYGAGNLVFLEVGGSSSTLDGDPVFQVSMKPRSAVGALDEGLYRQWYEWLQQARKV